MTNVSTHPWLPEGCFPLVCIRFWYALCEVLHGDSATFFTPFPPGFTIDTVVIRSAVLWKSPFCDFAGTGTRGAEQQRITWCKTTVRLRHRARHRRKNPFGLRALARTEKSLGRGRVSARTFEAFRRSGVAVVSLAGGFGDVPQLPSSIPVGMAPSTSFTGDTCSVHPTQASLYLPGPRDLKHVWLPSPFRQPSPAVTPREATRRSPGPWSERASQAPTTRGRREMSGEGGRLRRGGLKDEGTPRGASRRASRRRLGAAPAAPGPVWLLRHLRLRLPLSVGRLRPNMAPAAAGAAAGRGAASGGWKYWWRSGDSPPSVPWWEPRPAERRYYRGPEGGGGFTGEVSRCRPRRPERPPRPRAEGLRRGPPRPGAMRICQSN